MKRNLVLAFALVASLAVQSFSVAAHADPASDKQAALLMKKDAAQLAIDLKKMTPEMRARVLASYSDYLSHLGNALEKAEQYDADSYLQVGASGVGILAGGVVMSLPMMFIKEEVGNRVIKRIATLALRGTATTAVIGAVLLGGTAVTASGKFLISKVQAHRLRGQISRIQSQINVISALVDEDTMAAY